MPIETGCTHCGSDQNNTTDCPMRDAAPAGEREAFEIWARKPDNGTGKLDLRLCDIGLYYRRETGTAWDGFQAGAAWQRAQSALAASPAPEVPGPRPPEQPKPRPYDYQPVPEVAGIGRDADQLALDAANDIMQMVVGPPLIGRSAQLLAQIQCRVLDAIKAAPRPDHSGGGAELVEALDFYAQGNHLLLADPDAWDTCSGEPMNFLHDEAGTASVEDGSIAKATLAAYRAHPAAQLFQQRVLPWLLECFGEQIANDAMERNHRFLEEALELVQACGCTADEAHRLVDYVYGREVGERAQEVGGVMVTLAALCLAQKLDMHQAGEVELARITRPAVVERIREKQKRKPAMSPLPGVYPGRTQQGEGERT